jgi:hypothetical protein
VSLKGVATLALLGLAALAVLLCTPASASAPTAAIEKPSVGASIQSCQVIEFSANGSFDPEGEPLYYIWTLPNETVQGLSARVIYYANLTVPGVYNYTLTVRDNESLEDNQTRQLTIRPCNTPPVAVIASPADGARFFTDDFINFSAQGSSDSDGFVSGYRWTLNGTTKGSGLNTSFRLDAGAQVVMLTVSDNDGGEGFANITLYIEVNEPPRVGGEAVSPLSGFAGDLFTFTFNYTDVNGEAAAQALLLLDGAPHAMALSGGSDPRVGQMFALTLPLGAGRHSYYVLAQDGNLTNLSATHIAPDVFENLSVHSADEAAVLELAAVPPHALALGPEAAALPADPAPLVAVSRAYFANASAVVAGNYTLVVSFTPGADINASSAMLMRLENSEWRALVTTTDRSGHTASVEGEFRELPAVFRVFARHSETTPNAPPALQITHHAPASEYYPNSTVTFDAGASTDPENATLLYAWRFSGPGVDTGWVPGPKVELTFPQAGLYVVELRGDDGSGAPAFKNTTLEIRERPPPVVNTLEEPLALAGLAGAVAVSALLAIWWRGRGPKPKRGYDDQYGAAYKQKALEEKEYAQLFEKFAVRPASDEAPPPEPEAPESDPPADR